MRKTPLKRKSKSLTRKTQDLLWQECRRIILKRYAKKDGTNVCYTCDKPIEGSNRQVGHFIPNSVGGALLRYNLNNLRPQCYYCNINLGGNGSEFYRRMVKECTDVKIDELFALKQQTTKAQEHYEKLLAEYKELGL